MSHTPFRSHFLKCALPVADEKTCTVKVQVFANKVTA